MTLAIFLISWNEVFCVRTIYEGETTKIVVILLFPSSLRLVREFMSVVEAINIRLQNLAPHCPDKNSNFN